MRFAQAKVYPVKIDTVCLSINVPYPLYDCPHTTPMRIRHRHFRECLCLILSSAILRVVSVTCINSFT